MHSNTSLGGTILKDKLFLPHGSRRRVRKNEKKVKAAVIFSLEMLLCKTSSQILKMCLRELCECHSFHLHYFSLNSQTTGERDGLFLD